MHDEDRLNTSIQFLKQAILMFDEIFEDMEKAGGWLGFNAPALLEIFESLGVESWAEYYLDENKMHALSLEALFDEDSLQKIATDPDSASEEMKVVGTDILANSTEEEEEQTVELPIDSARGFLAFLTFLHDFLACMVHGESLCKLVAAARDGDDDAFCKAVQIDRTILFLPFAKKRIMLAQFGTEDPLLRKLGSSLQKPIGTTKIRYRTLMFVFSFLDREGFLSLPHEELLDVCQELNVYGAEDVGSLRKRLRFYRSKKRH